jgi:hypothetical protein
MSQPEKTRPWVDRAYALLGGIVGGVGFMCGLALRWRYRNERPKKGTR